MSDDEDVGPSRVAIGISFGNSYSSIAFTGSDGRAEVIANEEGDRQIPSVLSYVAGEEFQGTQAKAQLVRNPRNTIAYFRDLLGKDFKSIDVTPCHASAHPVAKGKDVAFHVADGAEGEEHDVTVSEAVTRYLKRLKTSAGDFLGKDVSAAVMTVPTDFSDEHKIALQEAAKNAGLEVLQFVNEPVAALLAYDARLEAKVDDKIVVVADLGGTRSDVAIIASRGGMYSILATAHDYALGGAQLDEVLMDYFAKEFMKKNKTDPRANERSLAKLKLESESVKKALSIGASASFSQESLADGVDYTATINRSRYEILAMKVFARFTRMIEDTIQKASLDPLDIDEIILSGGTAHTPKVAGNLQSHFAETTVILAPSTSTAAINPSELAARGAAIQASLIAEFDKEDIDQSTHPMVTVTPHLAHGVGIACVSTSGADKTETFLPIIPPETAVPVRRTASITAPKAGGSILVKVCEGQRGIKVTQAEKPPRSKPASDDEGDSDDDDSDDEPEEVREKIWNLGTTLAEASLSGLKGGATVEVQLNVAADLAVQLVLREKGSSQGVRGGIEGVRMANGKA